MVFEVFNAAKDLEMPIEISPWRILKMTRDRKLSMGIEEEDKVKSRWKARLLSFFSMPKINIK